MKQKAKELGLNLNLLKTINLMGKGGKENIIKTILSKSWKRKETKRGKGIGSIHDFVNTILSLKLEIKNQEDLQWFDPGKYDGLTDEEKEILMLFIVLNKQRKVPDACFVVKTGDFIESTFSKEQLKDSREYKTKYPKTQIKHGVHMRKWFKENRDKTNVLYIRNADINNV